MNISRYLALVLISVSVSVPALSQGRFDKMIDSAEVGPAQTTPTSLWNGGFDKHLFQLVFGYANKTWLCTYPNVTQREDIFGNAGCVLSGAQFGFLFTPSFDWGLGVRTGIFFEGYTSYSYLISDKCHHFSEADLYIPVQPSYRIPFTDECCLDLFGGVGFQWAMAGKFYQRIGTSYSPYWRRPTPIDREVGRLVYGNGWPQQVNWQGEFGASIRYDFIALSCTYSIGFVDHGIENSFDGEKTFVKATNSHQDKLQISVAFIFF